MFIALPRRFSKRLQKDPCSLTSSRCLAICWFLHRCLISATDNAAMLCCSCSSHPRIELLLELDRLESLLCSSCLRVRLHSRSTKNEQNFGLTSSISDSLRLSASTLGFLPISSNEKDDKDFLQIARLPADAIFLITKMAGQFNCLFKKKERS